MTLFRDEGLGLGLVEAALVDQGAKVTVVAREKAALAAVEQRLGVAAIAADVTDQEAARRILADVETAKATINAGEEPARIRLSLGEDLAGEPFTNLLSELERRGSGMSIDIQELTSASSKGRQKIL